LASWSGATVGLVGIGGAASADRQHRADAPPGMLDDDLDLGLVAAGPPRRLGRLVEATAEDRVLTGPGPEHDLDGLP
jgi:hypothetical protein